MRRCAATAAIVSLIGTLASSALLAWGPQGHRLVALVAERHLTPTARQAVNRLLDGRSMADIAVWADDYRDGVAQTGFWHYVNIPPDARSYDRDRDCPRQPGVAAGAPADMWRDCVVDRIRYNEERLADRTLDRLDRAIALKFLVHFVGDIHQPLHASAIERGGNGVLVRLFGSDTCGGSPARPAPCNLHAAWDVQLIAHRGLSDSRYLALLETRVTQDGLLQQPIGTAAEWAMESLVLSNAIMLPQKGEVDEAYFRKHLPSIDERLARGGTRLAALLNRTLGER